MRRCERFFQTLFLLAPLAIFSSPAFAQWAEAYERGIEQLRRGEWSAAAGSLRAAIKRQAQPELNAREYGLNYFEYLPYYQLGRALFFQLDFSGANENFERELAYGVIQKSAAYQDLVKLRETARRLQTARSDSAKTPPFKKETLLWLEFLEASQSQSKRKKNLDSLLEQLNLDLSTRQQLSKKLASLPRAATSTVDSTTELRDTAIAAFLQGRYREALKHFERLAQISPQDPTLQEWQQRLRFELIRLDQPTNAPEIKTDTLRFWQSANPIVVIRAPEVEESETRRERVTLQGTAHDDIGIAAIEIVVNGEYVQFANGAKQLTPNQEKNNAFPFAAELPLRLGENQIVVTAYDLDREEHRSSQIRRIIRRPPLHQTTLFWMVLGSALLVVAGAIVGNHLIKYRITFINRYNPYIAGAPIRSEGMFFGRQQLLDRILRTLPNNSLMVYGPRRIGKTSVQYQLLRLLKARQDPDYHFAPVFIDLQGVPEEIFFAHLIEEVREQLGGEIAAVPAPADRQKYGHRELANDLRSVINILQSRLPANKKVRLVLLIDEVDALNRYSERTNQRLRAIFMKSFSENLVAVLTGSNIRQEWESESSPWYNFFEQAPMPALSRDEALQLIHAPVRGFFKFAPEAADKIWEVAQGRPFVIQKFCVRLVNLAIEKRRRKIAVADVEAIRNDVMQDTASTTEGAALSV